MSATQAHRLRWLRRSWLVLCAVAGCVGLLLMALDGDELTVPILTFVVADGLLGLTVLAAPGAADPRSFPRRLSALVVPAAVTLLVQLLVGLLLFPVTLENGESADRSWFGVVALVVLLVGACAFLAAAVVHAVLLAPLVVVATRSRPALRGDPDAAVRVLLAVLMLALTAFVTLLGLTMDLRRGDLLTPALTLRGLGVPAARSTPGLLWSARAAALLAAALLVGIRVVLHRHPGAERPWRAS